MNTPARKSGGAKAWLKRNAPGFLQPAMIAAARYVRLIALRARQYRFRDPESRFAVLQQKHYSHVESEADAYGIIGNYDAHEAYPYEKYLLKQIPEPSTIEALDFGCGPGRMIRRMARLCARVDGVDISAELLEVARRWLAEVKPEPRLFKNDGVVLTGVPAAGYDLVYSTIAMQHIPVHRTREKLFREFARVLRPGGKLALQMAYSDLPRARWPQHAEWRDDRWDASNTNGACDVIITASSTADVQQTLDGSGFTNFSFELAPVPHPDPVYTHWIFLYAEKKA